MTDISTQPPDNPAGRVARGDGYVERNPFAQRKAAGSGQSRFALRIVQSTELFRNYWIWLTVAFFVGVGVALAYLALATPQYTISMVVGPEPSQTSTLSSALGSSPLASLAGRVPGSEVEPFTAFREVLFSHDVAQQLANEPGIMHFVFRSAWDATTGHWKAGRFDPIKKFLGMSLRVGPTADDLQKYVATSVKIEEIETTGLFRIIYNSPDPQQGVGFIRVLDSAADSLLRHKQIVRYRAYIEYVSAQLNQTTNSDQREALIRLYSEEQKELMITSANVAYSAAIYEEVSATDKPTSPNIPLTILVCSLGFPFALLVFLWMRQKGYG